MAEKKKILSPVDEELYDAADKPFDFVISEGETALVCESGDAFRKKISDALLKEEYLVTEAESVKDALRKMRFHTYDVIVVKSPLPRRSRMRTISFGISKTWAWRHAGRYLWP